MADSIDRDNSFRKTEAAIEARFGKLPLAPELRQWPDLLAGIGRELLFAAGRGGGPLASEELVGTAQTRRELETVVKQAAALRETLQELRKPALDALGWRLGSLRLFNAQIDMLAMAASLAKVPDLPANAGKGRKRLDRELHVAKRTAFHFERLTGEKATVPTRPRDGKAYGAFLCLVKDVFDLLGLEGKPEHYARLASRKEKTPLQATH